MSGRFLSLLLACSLGCDRSEELPFVSLETPLQAPAPREQREQLLRVGIAPVLSAVTSYQQYSPLVRYLSEQLARPAEFMQRGTYYEINEQTRGGQLDIAFVCTGSWLLNGEGLDLLAVPVIGGQPTYQAICLAHADSSARRLEDPRSGSFAFTDTLSFTGQAYMRARLAYMGTSTKEFFTSTVQVEGHDVLLHLVAMGQVSAGCINSVVYDQLIRQEPELMEAIRIVERSEPFGAPPVVVSKQIDSDLRGELSQVLVRMHEDPQGRRILRSLHFDRFMSPAPGQYDDARRFLAVLQDGETP